MVQTVGPVQYTGTNVTNLELYIEGPQPGVSYYVDDVTVTEVGSAATWKEEANARIEQIRKRDAKIRIVDSNNKPVSGVSIDVRQVKHEFGFGSAITMNGIHDPRYTEFFKNIMSGRYLKMKQNGIPTKQPGQRFLRQCGLLVQLVCRKRHKGKRPLYILGARRMAAFMA